MAAYPSLLIPAEHYRNDRKKFRKGPGEKSMKMLYLTLKKLLEKLLH